MWIWANALIVFSLYRAEADPADHYRKAREITANPSLSKEQKRSALQQSMGAHWGSTMKEHYRKLNPAEGSRTPRKIVGDGFKDYRPMTDKEQADLKKDELGIEGREVPRTTRELAKPSTAPPSKDGPPTRGVRQTQGTPPAPKGPTPTVLDGSGIPRFLEFPGKKP